MGILQQRQVFWNCTVPELLFLVRNCNQSWNVIRFSFEELLCCSDMCGLYFILLINYILKFLLSYIYSVVRGIHQPINSWTELLDSVQYMKLAPPYQVQLIQSIDYHTHSQKSFPEQWTASFAFQSENHFRMKQYKV